MIFLAPVALGNWMNRKTGKARWSCTSLSGKGYSWVLGSEIKTLQDWLFQSCLDSLNILKYSALAALLYQAESATLEEKGYAFGPQVDRGFKTSQ